MIESHWNDLNDTQIPWVRSFSRIVKLARPPFIFGDTILISSDYSGDHPKSKYLVFSILTVDLSRIKEWDNSRSIIRKKSLPDHRRISFKGLNDFHKRRAMPYFIESANLLNGLIVNVVISKGIKDIIPSNALHSIFSDLKLLRHGWSRNSFKRMSTLLHFVALVIAGTLRERQNAYWYSDEDNLFANDSTSYDVAMILGKLTGMYLNVKPGELGIGTTKLNEEDFFEEDLNSVPDLVAGALSEFFDGAHSITDKNNLANFAYTFPKNLSGKTKSILDWLSNQSKSLKKVTVVFDRARNDGSYKIWRFETTNDPRYST